MSNDNDFKFTWTIENCSKLISTVDTYLESAQFVVDESSSDKWSLQLYLSWPPEKQNRDQIYVFLKRNEGVEDVTVNCAIKLVDLNGKVFRENNFANQIFKYNASRWGFHFITVENLTNEMKTWTDDVLTIQSTISIKKSKYQPSSDCKAKTKIGINHHTFVWLIKEPDSLGWSQNEIFTFPGIGSLYVILSAPADDIMIEIKSKSLVNKFHGVTCKMVLLDAKGVEQDAVTNSYTHDNDSDRSIWKLPPFITKNALKEKKCIQNGFFTLIIGFFVPNGIIVKEIDKRTEYEFPSTKLIHNFDDTLSLQEDLKQMFLDKEHSDVTLKVDGEMFHVHKCLLSSRSPVFRAMFSADMLENQTNVVNISDTDSATIGDLLKFLYTQELEAKDCESTLKVLLAADKYQVESLKEKCAERLLAHLSEKNVCDIIVIADMVEHKMLKALALQLIEKHAATLLISKPWSEWAKQNIDLASEIVSRLAVQFVSKSK